MTSHFIGLPITEQEEALLLPLLSEPWGNDDEAAVKACRQTMLRIWEVQQGLRRMP